MPLSANLAAKSVQAAVAAIEIYNKPAFSYREEAFSLLMTNAWELLLKAKWLFDRNDVIDTLYDLEKDSSGVQKPKENRSGNPISHGIIYLAKKLLEDKTPLLERATLENILALVEIRDNSAHLINSDLYLGRRVLEIGTASLRNYLYLSGRWFHLDLAAYNFFLMPISFHHGFETVEPATRANYPGQIQKLLAYLDAREATDLEEVGSQHVALRLETQLMRGKDTTAVEFRYTDNPEAPSITVRQEDVLKNYPMTYDLLTKALDKRYSDFLANDKYHRARRGLENEKKFCLLYPLNPTKPTGACQRMYNTNVFSEFDKYYIKRQKQEDAKS